MGRIRQALLAAGARVLTKPRGRYHRHQPNNLAKLRRLIAEFRFGTVADVLDGHRH